MPDEKALDFYRTQSPFTDPGPYAGLFDALPDDIAALSDIVQGLVYHYVADEQMFGWQIPKDRLCEIDSRYVKAMLRRLIVMENRPLNLSRDFKNRVVGCCRDVAVLCCAMARHKGIPARTRVGFASYFFPGHYIDHEILEYWNGERWVLVDPELSARHITWFGIHFDVQDVPRDQFIVGGQAWQMIHSGIHDADRFCVAPNVKDVRGEWFVRSRLVQDLAALNKHEMVLWEQWGLNAGDVQVTPEDRALLDQVAALTVNPDAPLSELQALYAHDSLKVPSTVQSFSPAVDPSQYPLAVDINL